MLLAIGASMLFGASSVIAKRGLVHIDAQVGSLVSIGTVVAIYGVTSPLWIRAEYWTNPGMWVFVLNGLFHPVLSMYLAYESTRRAGPTIAATFAATAPLFAALLALVFLGERITVPIAIGTLATIAGIVVISWGPGGMPRLVRIALVLATGTAMIRGANNVVAKFGLELLPSPYMASLVSFGVSFACALAVYRVRYGSFPSRLPRAGVGLFMAAGAFIGGAILCMYAAIQLGRVVVVSPIVNTYPLFTLLFGYLLRDESITTKLVAGVVLVVAGVALISGG